MKNADKAAMPVKGMVSDASGSFCGEVVQHEGLTKREMFAIHAMSAMLSSKFPTDFNDGNPDSNISLCSKAVGYADALLEELEK